MLCKTFYVGKIVADDECCICYKSKSKKGGGYEQLSQCITEKAALTLQESAIRKGCNQRLLACVSGQSAGEIIAQELKYHRSCYTNFTRKDRDKNSSASSSHLKGDVLNKLFDIVEKSVLEKCELLTLTRLTKIYVKNSSSAERPPDKRTLCESVISHFGDRIDVWSPKFGDGFLFNNTLAKGEIIQLLFNKLHKAKKKKTLSLKRQIEIVGKAIKKEVKYLKDTYPTWPPSEDEIVKLKTATPPLLESLITTIVSSVRKCRLKKRKKKIIESICQDIIYNSLNGKYRCSKHAVFGWCVKRKTGSREMVEWLNRMGHCISYDEVNFMETSLALQAIKNESVKSYCPSSLVPLLFLTFVWDNNDINPETLNGKNSYFSNCNFLFHQKTILLSMYFFFLVSIFASHCDIR